ncbi:hypothetical protein OH687_24125 [Burkholderia anthina]|nr:hypothetical protein OH687_24125 [Burkholderia anthina]
MHDGKIGADRDPRTASLQRAKCHRRHSRAFSDLLGRQFPAQTRELEPLAEFDEQPTGCGQERGGFLCHDGANISLFSVQ